MKETIGACLTRRSRHRASEQDRRSPWWRQAMEPEADGEVRGRRPGIADASCVGCRTSGQRCTSRLRRRTTEAQTALAHTEHTFDPGLDRGAASAAGVEPPRSSRRLPLSGQVEAAFSHSDHWPVRSCSSRQWIAVVKPGPVSIRGQDAASVSVQHPTFFNGAGAPRDHTGQPKASEPSQPPERDEAVFRISDSAHRPEPFHGRASN